MGVTLNVTWFVVLGVACSLPECILKHIFLNVETFLPCVIYGSSLIAEVYMEAPNSGGLDAIWESRVVWVYGNVVEPYAGCDSVVIVVSVCRSYEATGNSRITQLRGQVDEVTDSDWYFPLLLM